AARPAGPLSGLVLGGGATRPFFWAGRDGAGFFWAGGPFSPGRDRFGPAAGGSRTPRPGAARPLGSASAAGGLSRAASGRRLGRSPLRSSTAPISVPSVNAIEAGPSHGSSRHD